MHWQVMRWRRPVAVALVSLLFYMLLLLAPFVFIRLVTPWNLPHFFHGIKQNKLTGKKLKQNQETQTQRLSEGWQNPNLMPPSDRKKKTKKT